MKSLAQQSLETMLQEAPKAEVVRSRDPALDMAFQEVFTAVDNRDYEGFAKAFESALTIKLSEN